MAKGTRSRGKEWPLRAAPQGTALDHEDESLGGRCHNNLQDSSTMQFCTDGGRSGSGDLVIWSGYFRVHVSEGRQ